VPGLAAGAFEESLLGPAQPIAGVLFSLIFVGSAVVLLAGGAVLLKAHPALARTAMGFSALTALLLLRKFLDAPAPCRPWAMSCSTSCPC
jgi:hypothetical protein